ncbi:MAG: hypothetical protein MAG715_00742 [Methanonatronarchaeales archaeon]|nr:hypothetical protein [Methanonatronarchaeales archaeon]
MSYVMSPGVRKFALTVHLTVSIGWIGAVAAYLALAIAVVINRDVQTVRAAFLAMELITWWVIVPLAFASLLTGLVMALGTRWGLFRHYWVVFSFLLTAIAIAVLLTRLDPISYRADLAADPTTSVADFRGAGVLLHPDPGLLVLLVITALNIYKPRGVTPFGRRKQQGQQTESET